MHTLLLLSMVRIMFVSMLQHSLGEIEAASADVRRRVEAAIEREVQRATDASSPPRLREALRYAVFPGGARLRPALTIAVALAYDDPNPREADASAAAVELVHCASLVHDDLPCFDDAAMRRGRPSVHAAFGQATAVLVGDALIVHAFDVLAHARAIEQIPVLASATGAARGIIAGQAWESEPAAPLEDYHRAKTASLFEAAAMMGALSASRDPAAWRKFGELVGRAYQVADDLVDALGDSASAGKSTGKDSALDRPSIVRALGAQSARRRVHELLSAASAEVPACPRSHVVWAWLDAFAARIDRT